MTNIELLPVSASIDHEIDQVDPDSCKVENDIASNSGGIAVSETVEIIPDIVLDEYHQPTQQDLDEQQARYLQEVTAVIENNETVISRSVRSTLGRINPDDLDDVMQEVRIRIYKHFKNFRGDSEVSTWIHRISRNAAYSFAEKRSKYIHRNTSLDDLVDELVDTSPDPLEVVETTLAYDDILRKAFGQLSKKYQEVIELRYKDISYKAIGERLGINESTAKVRAHRAREKLEIYLNRTDQQDEH